MNREIKFRGKRKDDEDWIYGFLVKNLKNNYSIQHKAGTCKEVIAKTVGEYTGLKDKNGKEIYEGDIIKFNDINFEVYQHECGEWRAGERSIWEFISEDGKENEWEVIGNVHDNPELLEV